MQFVTLKSSVPQIISQSVSKVYETTALLSAKGFTEEFDDNVEYGFYYVVIWTAVEYICYKFHKFYKDTLRNDNVGILKRCVFPLFLVLMKSSRW